MQLGGFGHHVKLVMDVPTQQRGVGRAAALEGHVRELSPGFLRKHHAHEVGQRARARRAVGLLARFGLGFGHHVGNGFGARRRPCHHAKLEVRQQRDGREIGHRVVVQFFVHVREQHHGTARQDDDGLPVGRGALDLPQRDAPARTGFVVHHDTGKVVFDAVCHQSGQQIGRAAGWETHQNFQGGFVLCPDRQWAERGCEGQGGKSPGASLHGVSGVWRGFPALVRHARHSQSIAEINQGGCFP